MTDQELLERLGVDALITDDGREVRRRTPRELVKVRVHEISAVDRPANRRPFLIVKQDGTDAGADTMADAQSFDDMMARRRIGQVASVLEDHYVALIDTLASIANSEESGKAALVRAALDDYLESIKGALDNVIASAFNE
jgi:hypothetical protein